METGTVPHYTFNDSGIPDDTGILCNPGVPGNIGTPLVRYQQKVISYNKEGKSSVKHIKKKGPDEEMRQVLSRSNNSRFL